ncbi:MAG: efflux RND transporter permease subunit [Bacteroidia bacterium]|nr:efflux RND transporter permease subunit [Bacteroidia bacterium]
MNLTRLSLDNNRVTLTLVLVAILLGISTYMGLERNDMPPFTIRVAQVVTAFPGAGPERVESLVTDPLEQVVQELPELDYVSSESRTGVSIIQVNIRQDVPEENLQEIWDRLRRKIDAIRSSLPDNISEPDIKDDGIGVVYGIMLGMENDGFTLAQLEDYANDIKDELIRLPDAARVKVMGLQEEQIFVEFDNAKLAQVGLSAGQLQNYISSTNILFPGGQVNLQDERIILEPTGNFESLKDLEKLIIPVGQQGGSVYLGDITEIRRGYESPTERIIRVNGAQGLAISVSLKEGANIVELGKQIDEKIAKITASLPVGINLYRAASQDNVVAQSIDDFLGNLMQSVVIVLLTMFLFLGLRTGVVVASLIPLAIITTIFLMGALGVGLNKVSLAALIMALGMLVDNAIVMAESIMVKMENGESARDAAIGSCAELAIPLLISSLTTSAAFLSFYLAESTLGDVVGPLFVVISLALLSSWLLSLTVVALLATLLIKVKSKESRSEGESKKGGANLFDRINKFYIGVLIPILKRPLWFLLTIIAAFVFSVYGLTKLPFIFFPDSERNLITVDINLPTGTRIESSERLVKELEGFLEDSLRVNENRESGVVTWTSFIGEGPESYDLGYQRSQPQTHYAHILVNTSSGDDNDMIINAINRFAFKSMPDAVVKAQRLKQGGGSGVPVQVRLSGDSPDVLFRISDEIKQKLNTISGTRNLSDDWGPKIKKLVVDIDETKARRAGLSNQDIALSLQTVLSGFETGDFRQGEDNLPIILKSLNSQQLDVQQLQTIDIFAQNSGRSVPLAQVATLRPEWQYAKIKRRDLFRTITVDAYLQSGFTAAEVTSELRPWLEEFSKNWPEGYTYELGGEAEDSASGLNAVIEKLPLSGFLIVLLLILQFNSFRKTAIVLGAIPLGLIGVVLGLLLFKSYFGFFAFLGIISLAGIIINNAIVLLDRIELEQNENGHSPWNAIIEACQQRLRPILLTTFTTTLGLIPLYLGGGLMWEPMAIGIMIGLLFGTVITLLFVPALYLLLYRVKAE